MTTRESILLEAQTVEIRGEKGHGVRASAILEIAVRYRERITELENALESRLVGTDFVRACADRDRYQERIAELEERCRDLTYGRGDDPSVERYDAMVDRDRYRSVLEAVMKKLIQLISGDLDRFDFAEETLNEVIDALKC